MDVIVSGSTSTSLPRCTIGGNNRQKSGITGVPLSYVVSIVLLGGHFSRLRRHPGLTQYSWLALHVRFKLMNMIISSVSNLLNTGVTLMCHIASLTASYIGFAFIQLNPTLSDVVCVASGKNINLFKITALTPLPFCYVLEIAVGIHFAFLSSFTWLSVMSFDVWWTFR